MSPCLKKMRSTIFSRHTLGYVWVRDFNVSRDFHIEKELRSNYYEMDHKILDKKIRNACHISFEMVMKGFLISHI